MPHNRMAAFFGAAFLYAVIALVMGVRAFWRDIGEPIGMMVGPPSLWQALKDAGQSRSIVGAGHAGRHRAPGRTGGPAGGKMEARSSAGRREAHRHGCRLYRHAV